MQSAELGTKLELELGYRYGTARNIKTDTQVL